MGMGAQGTTGAVPGGNLPFLKMTKMKKSTKKELKEMISILLCRRPMYPDPKPLKPSRIIVRCGERDHGTNHVIDGACNPSFFKLLDSFSCIIFGIISFSLHVVFFEKLPPLYQFGNAVNKCHLLK